MPYHEPDPSDIEADYMTDLAEQEREQDYDEPDPGEDSFGN